MWQDHILPLSMSRLRTIFVALLTLAVAALPAASVRTAMAAPGAPQAAVQSDCAEHMAASQTEHDQAESHHVKTGAAETDLANGQKDHDGMGPCADHPGCGGKCLCLGLALSAVMPAEIASATVPLLVETTARAPDSARSPAYIPPSPPPRV